MGGTWDIVLLGEGEGGVRGLFLVILLCEFKNLNFSGGGGGVLTPLPRDVATIWFSEIQSNTRSAL